MLIQADIFLEQKRVKELEGNWTSEKSRQDKCKETKLQADSKHWYSNFIMSR